jgi:ubiquinol-cytochrome c reductase cytochrome c subunit
VPVGSGYPGRMSSPDPHVRPRPRPPDLPGGRRRGARSWAAWAVVAAVVGVLALTSGTARSQQPSGQPTGPTGSVTAADEGGAGLYGRNCASCHGNQGEGTFRGPTLIGVGAASADYWVRSGRMPLAEPDQEAKRGPVAFTDAQIRLLVDHVTAFTPADADQGPAIPDVDLAGANLAEGGQLYRVNCASCHNWDGKGGALVNRNNAPPLHPVPLRQVAEAVRIGPGAMPTFTAEQLDEQELADVVAYVDYLRSPQDRGGFGLAHWGPSTETVAGFVAMVVLVLLTAWLGERRGR